MMDRVRGLIFDYGGTLDTGGCHWARFIYHGYEKRLLPVSWQQFAGAYVHAERTLTRKRLVRPDWSFFQTLEMKIQLQLEWLAENHHWTDNKEEREGMCHTLTTMLYDKVRLMTQESAKTLKALQGQFPMVMVSNFYGNLNGVIREFALDGFFLHVVESAGVGVEKPDPQIFSIGVGKLQMPPQQVMVVGDSIDKDMVPAHQLGCQTCWLRGEGWNPPQQEHPAVDRIINRLSDLTEKEQ